MPDLKIKNPSASIRQRVLNQAQERNDDFGLVLTKYGLERILFRVSKSKYRETVIRKGVLLFELWTKERYRATRDADFLAKGDNYRKGTAGNTVSGETGERGTLSSQIASLLR